MGSRACLQPKKKKKDCLVATEFFFLKRLLSDWVEK
jgi:hypothetical protein